MNFFKINNKTLTKNPSKIKTGIKKLQKAERTIDGTMVIDLIATKNTVQVSWDLLSNDDLQLLIREINDVGFVTIDYVDAMTNTETKQMIAQPGDISYSPYYDYATASILWKDVAIVFTEQ